jgi:Tetratricopeptide repeat
MRIQAHIVLLAVVTLCGVLPGAQSIAAQSLQDALLLFDQGTTLVENGRYTEALESFDAALGAGFESADLHYNRGIAYYRLDQLGLAIASFERASRLNPDNRMTVHNLSIARARIRDQISQLPTPFGAAVWGWIGANLDTMWLFLAGLVAYISWCALSVSRIAGRTYTDWVRRATWISAVVAVVGIGLGLALSARPPLGPIAVVASAEAPVFPDASATETPNLFIHEGLTVTVIAEAGEWTSIRLPNGVAGWVLTENLIQV